MSDLIEKSSIGSLKTQKRIAITIQYLLLIVLAFFFLFPTVFMFVSSIKNDQMQILRDMSGIKGFIPYGDLGFKNFAMVFKEMNFSRYMFNSLFIVVLTVGFGIIVNSMIAYGLARLQFPGKNIILALILALIIIPKESVVIPLLLMVARIRWTDSFQVQIVPFIADPFFIFLFYQFFLALPKSLDESALMDGAGTFRIYWRIILPLSKPIIATVAILHSLFRWGELLWPSFVIRNPSYRPLPLAMQIFFSQDPRNWGAIFAFATMITLPILILFLILQRWFIQSVASTGIKG